MSAETKIIITAATAQAEGALRTFGQRLEGVTSQLSRFSGLAGALSIGAFAAAIKRGIDASTEYQNALNGLASVARYAGEDISSTLTSATKLTEDGMLSVAEAATALKNLLARGFSTDQAVQMLMRFKDAAAFGRQGSLEFGQAVVSATEGIKNNISNLVDNAGVTKNISVMQKEYAATIGKTVGQLTEAEQRQAIYTGVLRETEAQLGNAALAAQGMQGAQARLNKALKDSAVVIGQTFTPVATDLLNTLTGLTEKGVKPFIGGIKMMAVDFGLFVESTALAIDRITSPSTWGKEGTEAYRARLNELTRLAEETKLDIFNLMNTPMAQLGADSGKRRSDAPTGEGGDADAKGKKQKPFDPEGDFWFAVDEAARKNQQKRNEEYLEDLVKAEEEAQQQMTRAALQAQRIIADVDPIFKASLAWEDLTALIEKGFITAEQAGQYYAKTFDEIAEKTQKTTDQMTVFAEQAGRNIQDAFAEFLFDPFKGGLQGMVVNFEQTLRRMAAQAIASNVLGAVGAWGKTGGGAGSFLGGIAAAVFGGGKASGGPVSAGTAYLVGERGPELFVPQVSGSITPNGQIGKSVTVINHFTISTPTDRRTQEQIAAMAGASIQTAMMRNA